MNKEQIKELMFTRVRGVGLLNGKLYIGELTGYDGKQFLVEGIWWKSIEPWTEAHEFVERWKGKKIRLDGWEKGKYVTPTGFFNGGLFEDVNSSGFTDFKHFDCEWKEFQEPEKRLITVLELAGKWLELDGVFTRVNRIITKDDTVKLTHDWHKVEELHEDGYRWCNHPREGLKSLEVDA